MIFLPIENVGRKIISNAAYLFVGFFLFYIPSPEKNPKGAELAR